MSLFKKLAYFFGTILGLVIWGILLTGGFYYIQNFASSYFIKQSPVALQQAQNSGVFLSRNTPTTQKSSFVGGIINQQLNPGRDELINRASKIGDFTQVPDGYYVTNAVDALGLTAVVAEHSSSQQYMAIVDTGWALKVESTDLQTGALRTKLLNYAQKILPAGIRVRAFYLNPKGYFTAFNQQVPYAEGKAVIYDNASRRNYVYRGIIGIVAKPDGSKNDLIVAVRLKDPADQKIAEQFFQKVKLQ